MAPTQYKKSPICVGAMCIATGEWGLQKQKSPICALANGAFSL
jgi:hypothetical protein